MKKQILTLIITLAGIISINAQISEAENALKHADNHFFIENKGQWPDEVLYLARIGGLDAWITKNDVLYDFYKLEEVPGSAKTEEALPDKFEQKDFTRTGHKICYKLKGNNSLIHTEGKEKQTGYYNYLIGNDPSKHASNVGLYKEALLKNVYDGIDVRYYFDKGNIRYDYVVHPGADPSQIAFVLEGTDKTHLNPEGDLVFNTRFGEIALAELQTYQGTKANKVASSFVKTANGWGIAIGHYDSKQTLIIDPLIYSTYLGGSDYDEGNSIAIDVSGNAYVTGTTYSANYNTTSGAYQTSYAGYHDVFVTKLNAAGTALVYSTYLGGGSAEMGNSIAIDTSGMAYVTGSTYSTNFNTTSGAYQTSLAGQVDVFVTKLNATGTALVYSTYLGGSDNDWGNSIAIDASGNAYVTGDTYSTNYDTTSGAYQTRLQGRCDAFVTKLNTTGTALVYSTYLGGSDVDYSPCIAIDTLGNAYVAGTTRSKDYDTTLGAYQTSRIGGYDDVFVTKLNAAGTALVYSTYLGGSHNEYGPCIAIDTLGNAYVTGTTESTDYDTTSGAYQTSLQGNSDAFVTKLNATGTVLVYSTYLGGSDFDWGNSIAIDASGNAYVTGVTQSADYDTTSGAYQTNFAGKRDIFVTKLNTTGTALVYSTFLGGGDREEGQSIAVDASGNTYITGFTLSANYDTTSGAYQTSNAGVGDVFVTEICLAAKVTIGLSSPSGTDLQNICMNTAMTNISYASTNATAATVSGLPSGVTDSFATNVVTISGTPTASGIYIYTVTLTGRCETVKVKGKIIVKPDNTIGLSSAPGTDSQSICMNTAITNISYATTNATAATVTGLPFGVTRSFAANVVTISGTPKAIGTHHYTVTLGGCGKVIAKGSITVKPVNTIGLSSASGTDSQSVCKNTAITDITYATTDATGATVTGLPAGVTGSFAANVVTISGTPTASGTFPYTITLTAGCGIVKTKGSITVKPDNTIGLSSASGTDSQSVKVNSSITNITYTTTGATGATITGLPAGVTGSFASNTVTISGKPTAIGTFPFTVILTGGCGTVTAKGSITVGGLGIGNQVSKKTLQIFPNPSDIEVIIKGTFNASVQIEIIDALGRISQAVYSLEKNIIKLRVSSLENGMYYIRIIDGGQVFQSKVIVQH